MIPSTYDHRVWRTGLQVRSVVLKPIIVRGKCLMRPPPAVLNRSIVRLTSFMTAVFAFYSHAQHVLIRGTLAVAEAQYEFPLSPFGNKLPKSKVL